MQSSNLPFFGLSVKTVLGYYRPKKYPVSHIQCGGKLRCLAGCNYSFKPTTFKNKSMKTFSIYNLGYGGSVIVRSDYFSNENGFDDKDVADIKKLEVGQSVMIGMGCTIVTRLFNR